MLDLQKLVTFRAVAVTNSFRHAAAELGYSQSSISTHIQALERELGILLFDRTRFTKEIALTEAGRRLLDYTNRLLALADETSVAIYGEGEPRGHLRIWASPSLLTHRLPEFLRTFQIFHPHVQLGVSSYADPALLRNGVLNGLADIGFVIDHPLEVEQVLVQCLSKEEILIVCAPDHPLTALGCIDPEQLARVPALFSDKVCAIRRLFEGVLAACNVRLQGGVDVGSIEAVRRCAIARLGFGVVPAFSVVDDIAEKRLVRLPWQQPTMALSMQALRHADRWASPAAMAFWDLLRSNF